MRNALMIYSLRNAGTFPGVCFFISRLSKIKKIRGNEQLLYVFSSGFREKICISLSIPYAASSHLHYAGFNDWQFSAYFYTKKGGFLQQAILKLCSIFQTFLQNYFLVTVNLRTLDFRVIRETVSNQKCNYSKYRNSHSGISRCETLPSTAVLSAPVCKMSLNYVHLIPWRTSLFAQTYNVMHFENYDNPVSVNLAGIALDDSLLLFKE